MYIHTHAHTHTHTDTLTSIYNDTGGEAELKFIVDMGLWGGFALGLVQMGFWLLWSPKWTLTAGGAAVGYATNLVALKVLYNHMHHELYISMGCYGVPSGP